MRKMMLVYAGILILSFISLSSAISTNGSVLYYGLDSGSGTRAVDNSTNSNNGTLFNTPSWVAGKVGPSQLNFSSASSEYVNSSRFTNINGTGPRTITFWGQTTTTGSTQMFVSLGNVTTNQLFEVGILSSGNYFIGAIGGNDWDTGVSANTNLNFHAITYNGSKLTWYINNVEIASVNRTYATANSNFTLGSRIGTTFYLDGALDEVSLWNRSLSTQDLSQLYNSGQGFNPYNNPISITQNSPANGTTVLSAMNIFNASVFLTTGTIRNATLYLYTLNGTLINRTTNLLSGLENSTTWNNTNVVVNRYKWHTYVCRTDNVCTSATNFTFTAGNFTEEFDANLFGGQSTNANLNITFDGVNQNILALLYWNNTLVVPSKTIVNATRIKFNSNFIVPNIGNLTGVNVSHYWRFYLPDGTLNETTTNSSQLVFSIGLDNCTIFSANFINLTMKDENTLTALNATTENTSIIAQVMISSQSNSSLSYQFNKTFTQINPARICLSGNVYSDTFRVDAEVRYTGTNYAIEYYNLQNVSFTTSNFPDTIDLLSLPVTEAQEFQIEYRDGNFIPVANALIQMDRQYLNLADFLTTEVPKTDSEGKTIGNFVLNDAIYNIYVFKEGRLLSSFLNVRAFCEVAIEACTIELNERTGTNKLSSSSIFNGVSLLPSYNQSTRIYNLDFSVIDQTNKLVSINITNYGSALNTSLCTNSVSASSGSLTCSIPAQFANQTAVAKIYVEGELASTSIFPVSGTDRQTYGVWRYALAFALILSLAGASISNKVGILISIVIGFILAGALYLIDSGGILGAGSAIIWLVVIVLILAAKWNKETG